MSSVMCWRLEFRGQLHKGAIKWPFSVPDIQYFEHHDALWVYLMSGTEVLGMFIK